LRQRTLFDLAAFDLVEPPGPHWIARNLSDDGCKCARRDELAIGDELTGWHVQHCGHPTALWPWMVLEPGGRMVIGGLHLAQAAGGHGIYEARAECLRRYLAEKAEGERNAVH
jgi:hypothetical protein